GADGRGRVAAAPDPAARPCQRGNTQCRAQPRLPRPLPRVQPRPRMVVMSMIEARNLTKRYASTLAADRLSFPTPPGTGTGFLGPNGCGKSTTRRRIMGLEAPDGGQARIGGRAYGQLRWPLREAGALLEARSFHPGRTARAHLLALAAKSATFGLVALAAG